MKRFHERDVRRFYDLLQHKSGLGLTQLNVLDGENLIGVGLFDNEDDFVDECSRYNTLGPSPSWREPPVITSFRQLRRAA